MLRCQVANAYSISNEKKMPWLSGSCHTSQIVAFNSGNASTPLLSGPVLLRNIFLSACVFWACGSVWRVLSVCDRNMERYEILVWKTCENTRLRKRFAPVSPPHLFFIWPITAVLCTSDKNSQVTGYKENLNNVHDIVLSVVLWNMCFLIEQFFLYFCLWERL